MDKSERTSCTSLYTFLPNLGPGACVNTVSGLCGLAVLVVGTCTSCSYLWVGTCGLCLWLLDYAICDWVANRVAINSVGFFWMHIYARII